MKNIELIIPCYNEESCIQLLYYKVCEVFQELPEYEFIITYVDDGSTDSTLDQIKDLQKKAEKGKVQYIALSRNFGKESAIYAGLNESTGDYVALMDADLQHPPDLLKDMITAIEKEGYDRVAARRVSKKGELLERRIFSRVFYHTIRQVTGMEFVSGSTDYCLMKRSVVEAILSLTEKERFTKGIYSWVGYKSKWIEYENVKRVAGKTKWSFIGLLQYAYSGFIAFATTPLRGVVYFGMLIVLFAVVFAIYTFIGALHSSDQRSGFATLLIVMLFLGGVIITILGMIGEYMARIYMEVKDRPIYLVRERDMIKNRQEDAVEEDA